ncbi:GyrI-like domain-containing protein [Companilactobacillus jidongensis]|uniref:GyrI-like domain-containing protein n=1 Tax=Companilactobacillus jidongensis TaxID=2486006 RepID=UPI000F792E9F|nr:GyrI-like domain-containing protein [Companilactobacillus jidongensis]
MKYEWRKQEKNLYLPKKKAVLVQVPNQRFVSLHGIGDPNEAAFKERLTTLYPISYGIKGMYKKYCLSQKVEFDDYVVFPLEGLWSLTEKGQQLERLDKSEFEYDIMMRIPDFVPDNVIDEAIKDVKEKKYQPLMEELRIIQRSAYDAIEILHVGKYDDEPASFALMDQFSNEIGRVRKSKIHREIYLSDARRVEPERLKTVLRYEIK